MNTKSTYSEKRGRKKGAGLDERGLAIKQESLSQGEWCNDASPSIPIG